MKQYIDKAALVAEIEKKTHGEQGYSSGDAECGYRDCAREILSFIDTLEVKEVDLGQEIKNRIDSLSNLYCYMEDLFDGKEEEGVYPIPEKVTNKLFEFAKYFFEFGMQAQKGE